MTNIETITVGAEVYGIAMANEINYSSQEQDTGLIWTDGKKIYQKTITGTIDSSGTNSIPVNISGTIETVVSIIAICVSSSTLQLPVGYRDTANSFGCYYWNNAIFFGCSGSAVLNKPAHITIRYTKATT